MNTRNKINFRQERNFIELFNDSIQFLIQERKTIGKILFLMVLPPVIVLFLIAKSLSPIIFLEVLPDIYHLSIYSIGYFIVQLIVYAAIKDYLASDGEIKIRRVWKIALAYLLPASIWAILGSIMFLIAIAFFVIPGIYFWVGTLLAFPAMFFADGRGKATIMRSFNLIKGRWWFTLGLVALYNLLLFIAGAFLLFMPFGIITGVLGFTIGTPSGDFMAYCLGYYEIVLKSVMVLANAFLAVLLSLHYFSQMERNEFYTLNTRIEFIGNEIAVSEQ